MTKRKAYILLLFAISSISLSPIFTRFSTAPSLTISAFRLLFASILTYGLAHQQINKGLKALSKSFWILSTFSGLVLALHFWAWIESLSHTSIASSTLLVCTHPLIVMPLSVFLFKEPLSFRKIAGIVLTMTGTLLLSGVGQAGLTGNVYGNLLALAGALFVGIYLLIGKKMRPLVDNNTYTFVVYAIATVFLWFLQLFSNTDLAQLTRQDYLVFILLAVFPTLFGHTLFNKVLETLSATTVSLATLGEPILASIYALFLFKENLTGLQLISGALIVFGIVVSEMPQKKKKRLDRSVSAQKKDEIFQSHKQNEGDLF